MCALGGAIISDDEEDVDPMTTAGTDLWRDPLRPADGVRVPVPFLFVDFWSTKA